MCYVSDILLYTHIHGNHNLINSLLGKLTFQMMPHLQVLTDTSAMYSPAHTYTQVKDSESFLKLTHDTAIHKIWAATDLQHNVQYVQTNISSSDSTRWGLLPITLLVGENIFGSHDICHVYSNWDKPPTSSLATVRSHVRERERIAAETSDESVTLVLWTYFVWGPARPEAW